MKSLIFALIPILIIGGLVAGGFVKVPGMGDPPKKHSKKKSADPPADTAADTAKDQPSPAPQTPANSEPPKTEPTPADQPKGDDIAKGPEPVLDPKKGSAKLALVWNDMDADKLYAVVDKWSDEDLAQVLSVMDTDKVVELLSKMPPERASALSKEIQHLASIVPDASNKS